jgi:hypothetical protein
MDVRGLREMVALDMMRSYTYKYVYVTDEADDHYGRRCHPGTVGRVERTDGSREERDHSPRRPALRGIVGTVGDYREEDAQETIAVEERHAGELTLADAPDPFARNSWSTSCP